jgi:hypothetical protein
VGKYIMFINHEGLPLGIERSKILWVQAKDDKIAILVIDNNGGGLLVQGAINDIIAQLEAFDHHVVVN